MIQIAITALSALAEEYVLARRVLTVLKTAKEISEVQELFESVATSDKYPDIDVENDEIFLYFLGLGLYVAAYRSNSGSIFVAADVCKMVDEAISLDSYYHAPPDSSNRLAAFAECFGKVIATYDPSFIDSLSDLVLYQSENQSIMYLVSEAAANSEYAVAIARHLEGLDILPEAVESIQNAFNMAGSYVKLTSRVQTIRDRMMLKSIDLTTSFPSMVYSILCLSSGHSTFINPSLTTKGSIMMLGTSIPFTPVSFKRANPVYHMWQSTSLTNSFVSRMENKLMASAGYTYLPDTKEWIAPARTAIEAKRRADPMWKASKELIIDTVTESISSKVREKIIQYVINKIK